MVKRPKSPEIIEEARYFTVCQPYPLNANWVFDKDQQDCATWIAECIGLEHLYAIHHKPSARGMILLEVSKMFTEHERLLGEHRWSEILTNPDKEQETRVSQVFHSFYAKGREAQKDGWKVLGVKSSWFKNWVPGKGDFKSPYPPTHWCPIPVEDQTNKHLCRPLPVNKMPPPPRAEPTVVGSATWTQKKMAGKPTVEALKMSWDEEMSAAEAVSKLNERAAQSKPDAGPSVSVLNGRSPTTTSPTTSPVYPPLATSAPNKAQPTSNLVPLGKGKNKKNSKPVPLNQFIGSAEGGKKATPAAWNKVPPVSSAAAVLSGPVPKPTPRSANAWDAPIKLKASAAPVKKESPLEDYSSWGPVGTSTEDQENIWNAPLATQKKSKKGEEISASSTASQGNTQQPSSRQVGNIMPALPAATRDVPPHQTFRPSEEEEDSDYYDDIYIPYSNGNFTVDNLAREDMEYVDVNNGSERGGGVSSAVDSETSDARAVVEEKYQNLWASEDDPRAVPLPDARLICPTHHIACRKGICEDMSKILREIKRENLKAEWEEKKKKNKGKKKKNGWGSGDNDETNETAEVDGDNFTIAGPRGNRGRFGRHKKNQEAPEVDEPSYTGRLRAFTPEPELPSEDSSTTTPNLPVPSDHEVSGNTPTTNGDSAAAPGPERQLFEQW